MKRTERRLRHGELITKAWNPSLDHSSVGFIEIEDKGSVELRALRITSPLVEAMRQASPGLQRFRCYALGDELRIIASIDDTKHGRMLHVSTSCLDRYPTWPELIAVKRYFYPDDVAAVMVAPEEEVYVNVQSFTM